MKKIFTLPLRFTEGFLEDDCYLWASAISYYTLLSIVPVLAIVFGIAKGFGFEQALETQILDIFYQQKDFAEKIITFAKSTLNNAHGTLIAGTGVIFLFWSSISLLGSFEGALNKIWNVPRTRTLNEKIKAYLPLLIFGPIIVIASSSLTFMITSKIIDLSVNQGLYPALKPAIHLAYYIVLFLLSWLLFLFLYTYMPNKFIPWKSCLAASFFTAALFQLSQWAYIHFQIYLTSYNAIYGSFAAIPLFLLWLQTAWLTILAGAELAKQYTYMQGKAPKPISERGLFLLVILKCSNAYLNRLPPMTSQTLAENLSLDHFTSEQVLNRLRDSDLLIQTEEDGFIPAYPPNMIMLDEVFAAVEDQEAPLFHVIDSPERDRVVTLLTQWDREQKSISINSSLEVLLKE